MAKQNKRKGSGLELEIVHKLNDIGYNTCSSRSNSKVLDNAKVDICDLDGNLNCYIQSKCTQSFPSYFIGGYYTKIFRDVGGRGGWRQP